MDEGSHSHSSVHELDGIVGRGERIMFEGLDAFLGQQQARYSADVQGYSGGVQGYSAGMQGHSAGMQGHSADGQQGDQDFGAEADV